MGTKRAGSAILYIRGANSRKGLKSISVSQVICDEYDEMPEHTVPLAQERMSGQSRKQLILISTPRFPGHGVNADMLESTQDHFYFPCPGCGKWIELLHENLVVCGESIHDPNLKKSYIKCTLCDKALTVPGEEERNDGMDFANRKAEMLREAKWISTAEKSFDVRGFYVNQLYAPNVYPWQLAESWIRGQTNKSAEQEYYNSKLGEAHEVDGARVSEEKISECLSTRNLGDRMENRLVTMGVDPGKWLHYEICAWDIGSQGVDINIMSKPYLLDAGKILHFEELDNLMRQYQVFFAVIDWQPETRKALEFAKRFWGRVRLCRYGKPSDSTSTLEDDPDKLFVTADRVSWLDMSLGRFHNKMIDLPHNIPLEYKQHMKNIARIYKEDKKTGHPMGDYINKGPDHHAHARNYCEIALPLAASIGSNQSIRTYS